MNPIVLHLIPCDDVAVDPERPLCHTVECIMTNLVATDAEPYPLLKRELCVYAVLTACRGRGVAQVVVAVVEPDGSERRVFGSAPHPLNFAGRDPVRAYGFVFRVEDCEFERPGQYVVQFCYDGVVIERRTIHAR